MQPYILAARSFEQLEILRGILTHTNFHSIDEKHLKILLLFESFVRFLGAKDFGICEGFGLGDQCLLGLQKAQVVVNVLNLLMQILHPFSGVIA